MNMLLEVVGIVVTLIAVAGVILNNHHSKKCFYFWVISNWLSFLIHVFLCCWSLALRDLIFIYLAIDGLIIWTKHEKLFKEPKRWQT